MNPLVAIAAIWFGVVLGFIFVFCAFSVLAYRRELNRQSNTWRASK